MSIFQQFQAALQPNAEGKTLHDRTANMRTNTYFDCEASYIVAVERLKLGIGENPEKNYGKPFFAGNFKVRTILGQGYNGENSMISVGTVIDYQKWLPTNPARMATRDEFNLAESLACCSAILKLQREAIDLGIADGICADDGARVAGRTLGVDVRHTKKQVQDASVEGGVKTLHYYNATWWACDDQGNRIPGFTLAELGLRPTTVQPQQGFAPPAPQAYAPAAQPYAPPAQAPQQFAQPQALPPTGPQPYQPPPAAPQQFAQPQLAPQGAPQQGFYPPPGNPNDVPF